MISPGWHNFLSVGRSKERFPWYIGPIVVGLFIACVIGLYVETPPERKP